MYVFEIDTGREVTIGGQLLRQTYLPNVKDPERKRKSIVGIHIKMKKLII